MQLKKNLLSLLILLVSVPLVARDDNINFGVRGGVNFSNVDSESVRIKEDRWNYMNIETLDRRYMGIHLGFFTQIYMMNYFLQPELLYTSIGNYMSEETEDGKFPEYIRHIRRIDIPVYAGKKVGPVRFGLGPVFSAIVGESSLVNNPKYDVSDERHNRGGLGFQFGTGFNLNRLVVDLKYEIGLLDLGDEITINDEVYSFNSKPKQLIVSIGILF